MQINPFERIRARALVGYAVLTFITTLTTVSIFFENKHAPYPEAAEGLLLYLFFSVYPQNVVSGRFVLQPIVWHLSYVAYARTI